VLELSSPRQMVPDFAELLIDDMEVIDQPFSGRCDRLLVMDLPGDGFALS